MRRLLLIVSILALGVLPLSCVDVEGITQDVIDNLTQHATGDFTIKIDGTDGLYFTGEYIARFFEGDPQTGEMEWTTVSYNVEGRVPEEYAFEAMAAAGAFQKQTEDQTLLRVEIWKDGVLQDAASTTDPWGATMVAGGP